jgi:hypothetical protein
VITLDDAGSHFTITGDVSITGPITCDLELEGDHDPVTGEVLRVTGGICDEPARASDLVMPILGE